MVVPKLFKNLWECLIHENGWLGELEAVEAELLDVEVFEAGIVHGAVLVVVVDVASWCDLERLACECFGLFVVRRGDAAYVEHGVEGDAVGRDGQVAVLGELLPFVGISFFPLL